MTDQSLVPAPIENSITRTLKSLARAKWPASWGAIRSRNMPATAMTTRRASMRPSDYRVFPDISPRPAVGLEDLLERASAAWESAESTLHDPDDAAERDVAAQKSVDRLLVGGVQDRRMPAAPGSRLPSQLDAGKSVLVEVMGLEAAELPRGGRRDRVGQAVGIRQGDRDRQAHVGPAQLGLERAVDELHQRVDDALRMEAHRDRGQRDGAQGRRLAELEARGHQGRD